MRVRALALIGLSALLLGADARAEEWLLRLAPEPGTRYRFEMRTEQTGKMESAALPSSEMALTNRMTLSQWLKGTDESGNLRLAWVYERLSLEADVGGNRIAMDTADESTDPSLGEAWGQLIGREIVILSTPAGEILEIEGLDELVQSTLADLPEGPKSQGVRQVLSQTFGEEQMKRIMQMSTAVYPEGSVGVGDVWSQDFEMDNPAMGAVRVSNDYTVTGVEDGVLGSCLAADVSTEMEFESGGMLSQMTELFRQQGAEVSMQMDIDVSDARGEICVDLATGMVGRMSQELQFVMDMSMNIQGAQGAQDLDMSMTMDVRTELRVVDTEPL